MPKSSPVPPLALLVAAAAKQVSVDPTQPHLYSGGNYMVGVFMIHLAIRAHTEMKIKEANR